MVSSLPSMLCFRTFDVNCGWVPSKERVIIHIRHWWYPLLWSHISTWTSFLIRKVSSFWKKGGRCRIFLALLRRRCTIVTIPFRIPFLCNCRIPTGNKYRNNYHRLREPRLFPTGHTRWTLFPAHPVCGRRVLLWYALPASCVYRLRRFGVFCLQWRNIGVRSYVLRG